MRAPLFALLVRESTFAARRLSNAPRFLFVAVLTVAAATAPSLLFQLVDRAVLPPLPFERSHELVNVWQRVPWQLATSYPKLEYLREHSRTMDVAAHTHGVFFLEDGGASIRLSVAAVTPNYFEVLAVRPLLGRTFQESENLRPLAHPLVILSETVWRSQFGARRDLVGEQVRMNGRPYVVVGVMPDLTWRFRGFGLDSGAWVPAAMAPALMLGKQLSESALVLESPRMSCWGGVGRLRSGHDLAAARKEAALLGDEVKALWPDDASIPFDLVRMAEDAIDPRILQAVSVLRFAGVLVLVLGGLNLASLFLTRGMARQRAINVQALLGAPRLALFWGPFIEALLVGLAGALGALALTRGALALLAYLEPSLLTAPLGFTFDPAQWHVDWPLVGWSFVLAVLTAVGSGLAPAMASRRGDGARLWRSGSGVLNGGLRRLRITRPSGVLMAAQVAFAVALTLPALLLAGSLGRLLALDIGLRPAGVQMAPLDLPTASYPENSVSVFLTEATNRVKQTGNIESVSWVSCVPIECPFFDTAVRRPGSGDPGFSASVHVVMPEAFRTLGIPLTQGRDFTIEDRADAPRVAILSELAARGLGTRAIGTRLEVLGGVVDVVGIVGDVPYRDLASEMIPAIYFPHRQHPRHSGVLVVRSALPSSDGARVLREAIASLDSRLGRLEVASLDERVSRSLARFRGAAWLLASAALLGLFLSAVGTYGLLSQFVAQAIPEIGIRMALGATRLRIGWMVGLTAFRLAGVGLLAGGALGIWVATHLRSYLVGTSPWDVRTLLATVAVAAAVALLTSLRPAQRASESDPMAALRCE